MHVCVCVAGDDGSDGDGDGRGSALEAQREGQVESELTQGGEMTLSGAFAHSCKAVSLCDRRLHFRGLAPAK